MKEVILIREASHTVSALGYTQKKCQTSVHDLELQKTVKGRVLFQGP